MRESCAPCGPALVLVVNCLQLFRVKAKGRGVLVLVLVLVLGLAVISRE